ncbi:MAG: AraC family transcriptional regulator [Candidatus Solibacter sp.]
MLYLHRVPPPPLNASIDAVWYCQNEPGPHSLERVLPNGSAQLIINLKEDETRGYHIEEGGRLCQTRSSGTVLTGVHTSYHLIDMAETECVMGVIFRPGGLPAFFGVPAHESSDQDVSMDLLWGAGAGELRERLLEAPGPSAKLDALEVALAEWWRPCAAHPAVSFALAEIGAYPCESKVAAITGCVGLSAKRFIEHFKGAVGVTPKQYCRIRRFQQALAAAQAGRCLEWTRIAADCGYFDQSHFIHDFRRFSGLTPTGYDARRTQFRNHVKFLQSDMEALVR